METVMRRNLVMFLFLCLVLIPARILPAAWLVADEEEDTPPVPAVSEPAAPAPEAVSAVAEEPDAAPPLSLFKGGEGLEVSSISVRRQSGGLLVEWKNPDSGGYSLTIYRDDKALDSPESLIPGKIVKTFPPDGLADSWLDPVQKAGTYFYAVTVTSGDVEKKTLTPEHSYNLLGVQFAPALAGSVTGIRADHSAGTVSLVWNRFSATNIRYHVYRSGAVLTNLADLTPLVTVIGTYKDEALPDGLYYYAVATVNEGGENKAIVLGQNSLKDPVIVSLPPPPAEPVVKEEPLPSPEDPVASAPDAASGVAEDPVAPVPEAPAPAATAPEGEASAVPLPEKVQTVITAPPAESVLRPVPKKDYPHILLTVRRRHFDAGEYEAAAVRFSALADDPDCPKDIADEARLFLGRTLYQQKKYTAALKIFVRLRPVYPEEADFWISRIASKL